LNLGQRAAVAKKVHKKDEIVDFSDELIRIFPANEGQIRPLLEKLSHDGERIKFWRDVEVFRLAIWRKRRHLSESQRAAVAVRLANIPRGGVRQGQNTAASQSANLQSEVSQTKAAELLQVSPRSVATAARIERDAPPEVFQAVQSGAMSGTPKRSSFCGRAQAQQGPVSLVAVGELTSALPGCHRCRRKAIETRQG